MGQRMNWVDVAKGLGIILVVMSHAPMNPELKAFLFAFHMPLFFYLSGAVFRPKTMGVWSFIKKKARSLLLPYFFFSALSYVFWYFITRNFSFSPGENVDPMYPFTGIFLSTPENYGLTYNPAIWFLTCLFIVEFIFFLYHKLSKGHGIWFFILFIGVAGYATTFFDYVLPWNGFVALTALVFYGIGYQTKHLWSERSWVVTIPSVTILFSLVYFIQSLNPERIDMRANILGEGMYFYLAALLGITAFLIFIQKWDHSRPLLFLGKNSIVILVLHMPILNVVRAFFHYGLNVDLSIANTLPWTILFTATTLLLTIPFIFLFNRFPWFLGKPPKQADSAKHRAINLQQRGRLESL